MSNFSVQVVVSCYNQEKYISECLDSILMQKSEYKFTILVSDDCSCDNTPEILKKYENLYPELIQVVYHEKNQGAAKNYLELHSKATGDIIFHMDGDDIMLPGKIQKQCEVFLDPKVNFCTHAAYYFNDLRTEIKKTGVLSESEKVTYFDNKQLAKWGPISVHSSYTYRRISRTTNDIHREIMEWFLAMDSLLPTGYGVFINEPLLYYRFNTNGSGYLSTKKGRLKAYMIYLNDLKEYHERYPDMRSSLNSNAIVTFLGIIKNTKTISWKYFRFILAGLLYFSIPNLIEGFKIRCQMSPK